MVDLNVTFNLGKGKDEPNRLSVGVMGFNRLGITSRNRVNPSGMEGVAP
jgi:hypothetical protein